ncbi:morphogenic membrane protein MmpB [Streptomyces hygroscopicus]
MPPLTARRPAENADEPPEELRRAQAMLRRARTVLAVAIMIATCLLSMRP